MKVPSYKDYEKTSVLNPNVTANFTSYNPPNYVERVVLKDRLHGGFLLAQARACSFYWKKFHVRRI